MYVVFFLENKPVSGATHLPRDDDAHLHVVGLISCSASAFLVVSYYGVLRSVKWWWHNPFHLLLLLLLYVVGGGGLIPPGQEDTRKMDTKLVPPICKLDE